MYKELLKQHEEILKKLTDKASKETDFGERGQFMNLQKMVDAEIKAIRNINEIIEGYTDKENDTEFYEIYNDTKEDVKTKPNKYVYAYTKENGEYSLIYIYNHKSSLSDSLFISDIRNFKTSSELSDAIYIAINMGFYPIIKADKMEVGCMHVLYDGVEKTYFDTRHYLNFNKEPIIKFQGILNSLKIEINENTNEKYLDSYAKITTYNQKVIESIECFDSQKIKFDKNGSFSYIFDKTNESEELLEEIILMYDAVTKELNK